MSSPIEDVILFQLANLPAGKSIDPMGVAKAVEPDRWQRLLGHVRNTAIDLAKQGRLVILRHNKPVDPTKFRGVYRLRLPMDGDPTSWPDATVEVGEADEG